MFNDIHIGPLTFHMYGLMTAIGIIAAYILIERRTKRRGLDAERILGLVIWCLIFGYLGSKLLYILTVLPQLTSGALAFRDILSDGWVIYGGLLGGILGGYLYCRRKKLPAWDYFDISLAGVALAQAFGRVGCFFAGCCYGVETDVIGGITFRHSHYAPNNVPLFPTQLLSAGFDFLLFLFLVYYDDYRKKHAGEPTGLYLILYSVGRFIIEFWRGDLARGAVGPLSTSQFIAIFVCLVGVIIYIRRRTCDEPVAEAAGAAFMDAVTEDEETAAQEVATEAAGAVSVAAAEGSGESGTTDDADEKNT